MKDHLEYPASFSNAALDNLASFSNNPAVCISVVLYGVIDVFLFSRSILCWRLRRYIAARTNTPIKTIPPRIPPMMAPVLFGVEEEGEGECEGDDGLAASGLEVVADIGAEVVGELGRLED